MNAPLPKALALDMDGVLGVPVFQFAGYLEHTYGLTFADTREFFTGPFQDCLTDAADLPQALAPFLPRWGIHLPVAELLAIWFDRESCVDARMLATVRRLRVAGLPCYVATNQERHRAAYLRQEMGLAQLFDGVYASADVGAKKPEPAFFARITAAIGLPPAEILFWDDVERYVEAAQSFGWQARHYTGFADFQEQMSQIFAEIH